MRIWAAFLIGAVLAGAATPQLAAWTLLPPILILFTLAALRRAGNSGPKHNLPMRTEADEWTAVPQVTLHNSAKALL